VRHKRRHVIKKTCNAQFARAGVVPVSFELAASSEPAAPTDVILSKENGKISALVNESWAPNRLSYYSDRLAVHVYWLFHSSDQVKRISVDISDGNAPSAARYRFSATDKATDKDLTLVPDAHFFRDQGYIAMDSFAAQHAPAWEDRRDDIVWRGGLNGDGLFSLEPSLADNPGVVQRLRMAQKCQQLDVDFRFIFNRSQIFCEILRSAGLTGDSIPPHDWATMKYAIDIDGYTNAWSNFMQRLKLGCCVLKVGSQFGYRQWYYDKLVPGEHFVPIRADLSDLHEKLDWVRTKPKEARAIAKQGQSFAKAMTFESERDYAIQAIEERELRG